MRPRGRAVPPTPPRPQFSPVSRIDDLTGYLMASVQCWRWPVAPARAAVGLSVSRCGHGLVGRGEVPKAALRDVPKEIAPAGIDCWSIDSDTPVGRLRHLGPTMRLSETPPYRAHPSVPLGYNEPVRPARAA
jgi:hypothetical protein